MTCFTPIGGWRAIQIWAEAVGQIRDPQRIQGYPVITRYLSSLVSQANGPEETARKIAAGTPEEVSRLLRELTDADFGARVSPLVSKMFEQRLRQQARNLQSSSVPTPPELTTTPAPDIDDPNQIVAYGASLKVGVPSLLKKLAALGKSTAAASQTSDWEGQVAEAGRIFQDLQRYHLIVSMTSLRLIDFSPEVFNESLEKIGDILKHLESVRTGMGRWRPQLIQHQILAAADSLDPSLADLLFRQMMT
jgi:hypothetical protein